MAEQNEQNNKQKSFSPLMTLLILAGVLCMQVGVVGAAYWMWGGASTVKADAAASDKAAKAEQPVEALIVVVPSTPSRSKIPTPPKTSLLFRFTVSACRPAEI